MDIYQTFENFWQWYARHEQQPLGFDRWSIVRMLHVNDRDYAEQKRTGQDELGFQPLSVTFADPISRQTKQAIIQHVDDRQFQAFADYHNNYFNRKLNSRFGSFRPEVFTAFAEYEDWNSFYTAWLERDGKQVMTHNMPLLFDHMPQVEYWHRKQTGQQYLPYQRLLVTTYFITKNTFYDFFIKNVSDSDMEQITLLMQSKFGLYGADIFVPQQLQVTS